MFKHFRLDFMADALASPREYSATGGGFQRDREALRGDAVRVAQDLNKAVKNYGRESDSN